MIPAECPWRDTLHWYDSIDSTNTRAKEMAASGAPHGTVLIADRQTGGRGRLGRSFHSPAGMGIYISVLLRPQCNTEQLMHLTCATAVAMCSAVEAVTGYCPGIKWTNDLVAEGKKLGGILTELSADPRTGMVQSAVIGIGINCSNTHEDFPPELQYVATSLETVAGKAVRRDYLAAAMVSALWKMDAELFTEKSAIMQRYRENCITLGRDIVLLQAEERRYGTAIDIDSNGGLVVRFEGGSVETVNSGEVSVRGMYGYV